MLRYKELSDYKKRGQVMLMTVLIITGTILGSTTIAGLLMIFQIRQASDIVNTTKAIFAADNGLEWRLNKFYKDNQACLNCDTGVDCPQRDLTNNSTFETECVLNANTVTIRSVGASGNASRAFEILLQN